MAQFSDLLNSISTECQVENIRNLQCAIKEDRFDLSEKDEFEAVKKLEACIGRQTLEVEKAICECIEAGISNFSRRPRRLLVRCLAAAFLQKVDQVLDYESRDSNDVEHSMDPDTNPPSQVVVEELCNGNSRLSTAGSLLTPGARFIALSFDKGYGVVSYPKNGRIAKIDDMIAFAPNTWNSDQVKIMRESAGRFLGKEISHFILAVPDKMRDSEVNLAVNMALVDGICVHPVRECECVALVYAQGKLKGAVALYVDTTDGIVSCTELELANGSYVATRRLKYRPPQLDREGSRQALKMLFGQYIGVKPKPQIIESDAVHINYWLHLTLCQLGKAKLMPHSDDAVTRGLVAKGVIWSSGIVKEELTNRWIDARNRQFSRNPLDNFVV